MNESVREEIAFFLGHTEKQLLAMLRPHYKRQFEFVGLVPKQVRQGDAWAQLYEPLLYGKLCVQEDLCAQLPSLATMDEIALTLHIADTICPLLWKLPPFMVAALLVKMGMARFCDCGATVPKEQHFRLLRHGAELYAALSRKLAGLERLARRGGEVEDAIAQLTQQREAVHAAIAALYEPEYAELLSASGVPVRGAVPTAQCASR